MISSRYMFASSIASGKDGMQLRQAGDRWISVPPDYYGSVSLSWTAGGLKIMMRKAVCYVRTRDGMVKCDTDLLLPWYTEGNIFLLQDDAETVFAQIYISKTNDVSVWNEYRNTIKNEEDRILSVILEQESYFWQSLSSSVDIFETYGHLRRLMEHMEDMLESQSCHQGTIDAMNRLKHLLYKYSVRLLNHDGQSEESLDRLACDVRSLMVDERHKL